MPATIALLGAQRTGKTTLSIALAGHLRARGHRVAVVPEALDDGCQRTGRPHHRAEQLATAQGRDVVMDEALQAADIVISDTTAPIGAIEGARLQGGEGVHPFAIERLRTCDLVLLMGLDLPWVNDGLRPPQAPQAREAVDALVRDVLARAGVGWRVIYGTGQARVMQALEAVGAVLPWAWQAEASALDIERWSRLRAQCEKCGDAACEHRLFTGLTARTAAPIASPK